MLNLFQHLASEIPKQVRNDAFGTDAPLYDVKNNLRHRGGAGFARCRRQWSRRAEPRKGGDAKPGVRTPPVFVELVN